MEIEHLPFIIAAAAAAAVKAIVLFRGAPRRERLLLACLGIAILEVAFTELACGFAWLIALPGEWLGVLGVEAAFALPPNIILADGATRGAEGSRKAAPLLLAILAYPILAGIALAL